MFFNNSWTYVASNIFLIFSFNYYNTPIISSYFTIVISLSSFSTFTWVMLSRCCGWWLFYNMFCHMKHVLVLKLSKEMVDFVLHYMFNFFCPLLSKLFSWIMQRLWKQIEVIITFDNFVMVCHLFLVEIFGHHLSKTRKTFSIFIQIFDSKKFQNVFALGIPFFLPLNGD